MWTATGDLGAGLLAGLVILPAVFAFGLEPGSGPGLIFITLPQVFAAMPLGGLFGLLFFVGLFGAAYLSDVGALEVLVAGIIDNTGISRRRAVWLMVAAVFLFSIPSMINMRIFVPWDLTFGSGMQILGSLLAIVALTWVVGRAEALRQLGGEGGRRWIWLYLWLRFVVPGLLIAIFIWWLLTEVLALS